MPPCRAKRAVVALNDAFGVALADGGGICVHGVEEELHGGLAAALEIARVVVRNHHAGVGVPRQMASAELVDGKIRIGEPEAFALGQGRDEFAALRRMAVVDDAQAEVGDRRAQSEAEEQQLQGRRKDQREGEAAIAADLIEFLFDQSAQARRRSGKFQASHSVYAFSCMRRMLRHARR